MPTPQPPALPTADALPDFVVRPTGAWFARGDAVFHTGADGGIDFVESSDAPGDWEVVAGVAVKADDGVVTGGKLATRLGLIGRRLDGIDALLERRVQFEQGRDEHGRWAGGAGVAGAAPDDAPTHGHSEGFPDAASLDSLRVVKALGGSTGAKLVADASGQQYVRKTGDNPGHVREEDTADRVYRALGVPVPDSKLYETPDGPVKLSKFLEGATPLSQHLGGPREGELRESLKKHFVLDALLGNWDVIGMGYDNVMVTPGGEAVRIDNGGSLRYRAMGEKKKPSAWTGDVGEIDSLRGPGPGSASAQRIFGGLGDDEVGRQARDVVAKRRVILDTVPADLREVLSARLDYLEGRFGGKAHAPQAHAPQAQATFVNPYHGKDGKFASGGEPDVQSVIPSREHLYRKRDLHAEGQWPEVRPAAVQRLTVAGHSLRRGEIASSVGGVDYLVTASGGAGGAGGAGGWAGGLSGGFGNPAGGGSVPREALGRRLDARSQPVGPEVPLKGSYQIGVQPQPVRKAYGGVLFDGQGRLLLREPRGHFGGYAWTFAKGGSHGGHPVDTALDEVGEETGHKGKIVGHVPGVFTSSPTSAAYFYLMHTRGHDASRMDDETESTRWVHPPEAKSLIAQSPNAAGRERDLKILDAAVTAYQNLQRATTPLRLRGAAVPEGQPRFSDGSPEASADDWWATVVYYDGRPLARLELLGRLEVAGVEPTLAARLLASAEPA